MRKVILFMHISQDGFVCGPQGELDWATMTDDKMGEYMGSDLLKTVDTILVGRVLFQGFEQYWPSVPENPQNPPELISFAHWMINTPKIVFSNTLKELTWKNSILVREDPATTVKKLKQEPGGDMVIFGGASLAAHFVREGLVDELRFKLEPIALGKGKSLYSDLKERMKLKLIHAKTFESGVAGLFYEVIK